MAKLIEQGKMFCFNHNIIYRAGDRCRACQPMTAPKSIPNGGPIVIDNVRHLPWVKPK